MQDGPVGEPHQPLQVTTRDTPRTVHRATRLEAELAEEPPVARGAKGRMVISKPGNKPRQALFSRDRPQYTQLHCTAAPS